MFGSLGGSAILLLLIVVLVGSRTFRLWFLGIVGFVFLFFVAMTWTAGFFIGLGIVLLVLWLLVNIATIETKVEQDHEEYLQKKTEREIADKKYKEYVEIGRKKEMEWKKKQYKK